MEGIHVLTNGKLGDDDLRKIPKLMPYIDILHIREKTKTAKELHAIVTFLLEKGVSPHQIMLNDRVDLAYLLNCRGVQLAHHSLPIKLVKEKFPDILIGKSVHSVEEAKQAEKKRADYLLYGHIFESQSKPNLTPKGLRELNIICESISIPVIAIGGITISNINQTLAAGAKGVAVMSSVWDAEDPIKIVKQLHQSFTYGRREKIAKF